MKKIFISILLALSIGFIFGFFFLKKFNINNNVVNESLSSVYAFQLGVYKNYNNALNVSNLNNGIIVNDNATYYVYSAILNDAEIIDNLKKLYDNEGINYYVKELKVSNTSLEIINNYEILLRSSNTDKYSLILKELMKELSKNEL